MKYVPLNRVSKDIGIFGKKGVGKTIVLSWLGYIEYKFYNSIVFSNYSLNYPHVFLGRSIENYDIIYEFSPRVPKILLLDDAESVLFSRDYGTKVSKELLNEILLNLGKYNCSVVYTAKREFAIDIGLRESTCEFWELELKPIYKYIEPGANAELEKYYNYLLSKYLNLLYIEIMRFDEYFEELPVYRIFNLDKICNLYSTFEKVEKVVK